jgi:hypothetical protein
MTVRRKSKKGLFSKLIVTLVVLLNTLFATAVLYVYLKVGSEPVALIGAWFSFTTGELWMLSAIRKKKAQPINPIEQEEQI